MSDEGMDPCECMWSHELAMRRLISFLRQSQSYCTDTECFDEIDGTSLTGGQSPENGFLMIGLLFLFAMIMYIIRPRTIRAISDNNTKPRNEGPGSNDTPPNPPPTAF